MLDMEAPAEWSKQPAFDVSNAICAELQEHAVPPDADATVACVGWLYLAIPGGEFTNFPSLREAAVRGRE